MFQITPENLLMFKKQNVFLRKDNYIKNDLFLVNFHEKMQFLYEKQQILRLSPNKLRAKICFLTNDVLDENTKKN